METEFIREYASRMSGIFASRATNALSRCEADDYVRYLEDRRDFWGAIAQLPPDSEKWELVKRYINLMSASASKIELRSLYKSLRGKICKAQKEDVWELSLVSQYRSLHRSQSTATPHSYDSRISDSAQSA